MTIYLASIFGIAAVAFAIGWRLGRARQHRQGNLPPVTAVIFVGLALAWFVAARLARTYADTDGFGADIAGWFAHSGKWLTLAAVAAAGHGFICSAGHVPQSPARKLIHFTAVTGLAALIGWRTAPVYMLLGAGQRDADHLVRQAAICESTCGAVALLNYLELFRGVTNLTEREVSRVCGVTVEGSTPAGILRAAQHYGLTNATARVLTWRELNQRKLPVIISISTLPQVRHATLLVGIDDNSACFLDPAYGKWVIPRERFRQIWYGPTLVLE